METYRIQIGDCVRQLPICPINENLSIAGFVMLGEDRKSTRLNSSHTQKSRMPSSA